MPEQAALQPPMVPEQDMTHVPEQSTVVPDQTTLLHNEAEAFALEPLDVTSIGKLGFLICSIVFSLKSNSTC